MTPEQTLNARADAVAEILTGRHPEHDQLALAINRARNAVMAGYSAHASLERGEAWIREAEALTAKCEPLGERLKMIPGTKVKAINPTTSGFALEVFDYATGRVWDFRIDDRQRGLHRLHGIDGGAA